LIGVGPIFKAGRMCVQSTQRKLYLVIKSAIGIGDKLWDTTIVGQKKLMSVNCHSGVCTLISTTVGSRLVIID